MSKILLGTHILICFAHQTTILTKMIFLQKTVHSWQDYVIHLIQVFAPKIAGAIVALILGFWIIRVIMKIVKKFVVKRLDENIAPLFKTFVSIALKVALILSVASIVGIETTSFVAVLGAVSFAIGLALQGSLSNFAGGILLLIFKPFKKGDFVEIQGYTGRIHEVQFFNTIMKTTDNRTIIFPNGPVSNGNVINYSAEPERRIDMSFSISYEDDIDKAKRIILIIINEDERIIKRKRRNPFVGVAELGESSVNLTVRVWAEARSYLRIYFDMQEKVKKAFDSEDITIPYPQRDVRFIQKK